MFKWITGKKTPEEKNTHSQNIDELKEQIKSQLHVGENLVFRMLKRNGQKLVFCYMDSQINKTSLDQFIIGPIQEHTQTEWTCEAFAQILPISNLSAHNHLDVVVEGINGGS